MFFDADNDECERLNDAEVLDDTPIGRLRCVDWGGTVCVAVIDRFDPERIATIIHQLEPGENPLSAVYAKRPFETPAIAALYDRRSEVVGASAKREHIMQRKDFRAALNRFLGKHDDGREAIAERLRVSA